MRERASVAAAIACILLLLEGSASAASFTWETHYADGAVLSDGDVRVQDGVVVTLGTTVFSDSDGGTFDLALVSGDAAFHTIDHDQLGGHAGHARLAFDNENNDPADYLELRLSFGVALVGLQFSTLDTDSFIFQLFDDGVEVTYNGGLNVRSNPSFYSLPTGTPTVMLDDEAGYEGFEGVDGEAADSDETTGNVDYDFGTTPISDITIRYFSTDDAIANPITQWLGVSDLSWTSTVVVPEPATGLLLSAGLMGLALAGRPPRR